MLLRGVTLDYQLERHVAYMLRKWPEMGEQEARRMVRALLIGGKAWLFPEAVQMTLEGV